MPRLEDFENRADYYAALDAYYARVYGVSDDPSPTMTAAA